MARSAVLCVLFACFAVAVFSQATCDTKQLSYTEVLSGDSFAVDAKALTTVTGIITVSRGAPGGVSVEYQKNQGYQLTPTKGLVTISKASAGGAVSLGANLLVTLALAALAVVSSRSSLAAFAIVLAIAIVALAACATADTVNVTVTVDQATLKSFTVAVKADPTKSACPSGITIAGDLKDWVTSSVTGTVCTYTFTNKLFGCPNTCGTQTTNVVDTTCPAGVCVLTCAPGFLSCAGDCLTADSDAKTCGTCKNDCTSSVQNVVNPSCTTGNCDYDTCAAGFSDCDNDKTNGCEAQTDSVKACGACNNDCSALAGVDPASVACNSGACSFTCAAGKLDCDGDLTTGCESDDNTDKSCGSCGADCTSGANSAGGSCDTTGPTPVCKYTCNNLFADCSPALGCETPVDSAVSDCGACGNNCAALPNVDNTATSCIAGKCVIGCLSGYSDCDNDPTTGCEAQTDSSAIDCGKCGNDCSKLPNLGSPVCTSGICNGTCNTGFSVCGSATGVGCPDDTSSSTTNCGVCGNNCPGVSNAGVACTAGVCDFTTCSSGFQNCDNDRTNGCETALTDKNFCGSCSVNCEVSGKTGNFASATCSGAVPACSLTCAPGFQDCDKSYLNGCEVNTNTNVSQCGKCGTACALKNAPANGQTCNGGVCTATSCNAGFSFCSLPATGGCVIDLKNDPQNCNACGTKCTTLANVASGITCTGGICQTATNCAAGFNDCDANPANGCETPTNLCTPTAPGSSCALAQAYTGANTAFNGRNCEDIKTQPNVLAASCNLDPAVSKFPLGTCAVTCVGGFSDCDGNPFNGCETADSLCGSGLTGGSCQTALKDVSGSPVSCLALITDPVINQTVTQGAGANQCNSIAGPNGGTCSYTCSSNFFDCDLSGKNGCEIDKRKCPIATAADCVFNLDTRCGRGVCIDCTALSGTNPGSATCNKTSEQCTFTCGSLCKNADNDWATGCESAQTYASVPGIDVAIDCSKEIDLTNVLANGPILCDGNATSNTAGRCLFTCKAGFADCDENPRNGCETALTGPCFSCTYEADVSCGKNKCVDCTTLEGTLGSDYANGRWASASASTCLKVNETNNERATDFYCDTSVHYLNPRFDPPDGTNGACQSELCRDLDDDWSNGCESAQQYGRGRFYYYGDSQNTDSYLVPYVPNPYEDRFYEYKDAFTAFPNSDPTSYLNPISEDIKILELIDITQPSGLDLRHLFWRVGQQAIAGYVDESTQDFVPSYLPFNYPSVHIPVDPLAPYPSGAAVLLSPSIPLSGREIALLHYAADNFMDVAAPADAAAIALHGSVYNNPVDCILSEWSDWGKCTYADDCIQKDFFRMTRIRTRTVIQQAANGGVCHLPLVEDFYRFNHRNSDKNFWAPVDASWDGTGGQFDSQDYGLPKIQYNFGADYQHGGGFPVRVDYTHLNFGEITYDINNVLLWGPEDWSYEYLGNSFFNPGTFPGLNPQPSGEFTVNDPKYLSWTGNELGALGSTLGQFAPLGDVLGSENVTADRNNGNVLGYGMLLTCAPLGTCGDVNSGTPKVPCNITTWSEWSICSAACDGDWAGGVRIRTRTVISGAKKNGECFQTEFDKSGNPLDNYGALAGQLYEEDWQCNDHSCASYNCHTDLRDPTFAAAHNIYLGADAVTPQCDGRDWPEYVNGVSWVDVNRDGLDDNTIYGVFQNGEIYPILGNFNLFSTIFNFSYEYRWPGHCLYECEEGWFDCDHLPENGCEVNGDFCSLDVEFGSTAQLTHPIYPWEHPHGECTLAWKHDKSGVVARDCKDFDQTHTDELLHTTGLCIPATGLCDTTCDKGYKNCAGDGCVSISGDEDFCGYACVDCTQLKLFQYGYPGGWSCELNDDEDDWVCIPSGSCYDGCTDEDEDTYNGCETAVYQQWPYPDVTPFDMTYDQWSAWTQCTRSDDCGYLWDMSSGANVFRNVPIQARYRRPVKSAYNGGFYPEFSYLGADGLEIEDVTYPDSPTWQYLLSWTPKLKDVLGIPLVQTEFYEVRVCANSVTPCIECTNQLEGVEQHCVLSGWSNWSACSAECVDRIIDVEYTEYGNLQNAKVFYQWDPQNDYYVTERVPYQIRTRSVTTPAALGGRCPPPLDTWQQAEAASHISNNIISWGDFSGDDLVDNAFGLSNLLLSAKASYLVDVRRCNTDRCTYPEDCDALNYWYPGHFTSIATCGQSTVDWYSSDAQSSNQNDWAIAQCVANTGFNSNFDRPHQDTLYDYEAFCDVRNGYCDEGNTDLRDGCDTFVYPTHCGRTDGSGYCDYNYFHDCTTLPGVVAPYAAPCVLDPFHDLDSNEATFARPNPADVADNNYLSNHVCDIRWACNATGCTNEDYATARANNQANTNADYYQTFPQYLDSTDPANSDPLLVFELWHDGCEVARQYKYPFVTVDTYYNVLNQSDWAAPTHFTSNTGNAMGYFYELVSDTASDTTEDTTNTDREGDVNWQTFHDPRNKYTLSQQATSDNSIAFSFDCHSYLYSDYFCGRVSVEEPSYYDPVADPYLPNRGCHLAGKAELDKFNSLGFGCNGVWGTPHYGQCVMNCAAGYVDADFDPRNGCETDVLVKATPEDRYVWVGDCKQKADKSVDIFSVASCGADKCVNCAALPGTLTAAGNTVAGIDRPNCTLVEERTGKIPVLKNEDTPDGYYSIQYACGAVSGDTSPFYIGLDDFVDSYCNVNCADGDRDWMNGCEQGRGYANGGTYVIGSVYDKLFDSFNYLQNNNPACTNTYQNNFVNPGTGTACDRRSSGFEYPIPGAWFFQNFTSLVGDNDEFDPLASMTYPAEDIDYYLNRKDALNTVLTANNKQPQTDNDMLNQRAFDCSLPYSTYPIYGDIPNGSPVRDDDPFGLYRYFGEGDSKSIYTFAEVHHVNVSQYPVGGENNICNRTDGLCYYVCQANWDDYDLDPSNGCEADLSGPCGSTTARSERRYVNPGSCGEQCVDCRVLPGAYNTPIYKSRCMALYPELFVEEVKHDYLLTNVRFVHTCSTEVIQPGLTVKEYTITAWENIICDPRACYDQDFDYENGCELATDYPYEWAKFNKHAWDHWYSPLPNPTTNGRHDIPETFYWVSNQGDVSIGIQSQPPSGPTVGQDGLYWSGPAAAANVYPKDQKDFVLDLNIFDFLRWDIRGADANSLGLPDYAATGNSIWLDNKWYNWSDKETTTANPGDQPTLPLIGSGPANNGNNIFPYMGITSAWDCSRADSASGVHSITIPGLGNVKIPWAIDTNQSGPWFHVDQSKVSQCDPGPDPGAANDAYHGAKPSIDPLKYCTTPLAGIKWATGTDKGCYNTWTYVPRGKCALACDKDWANGDADPSNGCESYLPNKKPYPGSTCGPLPSAPFFKDPAADPKYPNGQYNYNQKDGPCGAGLCLNCVQLPGVNHDASNSDATIEFAGFKSYCLDGGNDWWTIETAAIANYPDQALDNSKGPGAAKSGVVPASGAGSPTQAVQYPGDYYCTGVINENACLRAQLPIRCSGQNLPAGQCGSDGNYYPKIGASFGHQSLQTGSQFVKVCADYDDDWATGCEIALGYNLGVYSQGPQPTDPTVVDANDNDITLEGTYDRRIGVKPYYDGNYNIIDWTGHNDPLDDVVAGFDCEILRLLPPQHTHILPHVDTATVIECSKNFKGVPGLCSFKCVTGWLDCDGNPWNGCEQSDSLCGGASGGANGCQQAQKYPNIGQANFACTSANLDFRELAHTYFCDGNQLPYDDWHLYFEENANAETANTNDASQYNDWFEIQDWGIDYVNVLTDYVNPDVSRYTIKGYWDNSDIDYSCRVWLNINGSGLRTESTIPSDANYATGRCVVDCKVTPASPSAMASSSTVARATSPPIRAAALLVSALLASSSPVSSAPRLASACLLRQSMELPNPSISSSPTGLRVNSVSILLPTPRTLFLTEPPAIYPPSASSSLSAILVVPRVRPSVVSLVLLATTTCAAITTVTGRTVASSP